jgi:hypothetical protein
MMAIPESGAESLSGIRITVPLRGTVRGTTTSAEPGCDILHWKTRGLCTGPPRILYRKTR